MMKKIIIAISMCVFLLAGSYALASESTAIIPENEIPLKMDKAAAAPAAASQSGRLVLTLIILAGMAGTGFYFARKYAFSNKINKSNMQIKILTQHHLGPKKSLAIVRVAGESILIGVTDQNISMIKSLSLIDDEVPAEMPSQFSQAMAHQPNSLALNESASHNLESDPEDDFSFSGIKSNVSQKLKSMRNIQ